MVLLRTHGPWGRLCLCVAVVTALTVVACGGGGVETNEPSDTTAGDADIPVLPSDSRDSTAFDRTPDKIHVPDGADDTDPAWLQDVAPGTFGAPCVSNDDCEDGWCVGWDEGFVCSRLCISDAGCGPGWECRQILNAGADDVFACFPSASHLCQRCTTDRECGRGRCAEVGGEQRCTRSCSTIRPCPDLYECRDVEDPETGQTDPQCYPVSGDCTCSAANDEERRSCVRSNESGECWGYEECDAAAGWSACSAAVPSVEQCNGEDDDCDGIADEDLVEPAEPCENSRPGIGTCVGSWSCRGRDGWVCIADTPTTEVCDYYDNDCDDEVDEGFRDASGVYGTQEHCGVCNYSCEGTLPRGSERCDTSGDGPVCVIDECDDGFYRANDFTCLPLTSSLCLPCVSDVSCLVPGDRCLDVGGEPRCGRDCGEGALYGEDCPEGYACESLSVGGETVRQCVPRSGSCDCTPASDGAVQQCSVTNEHGTCFGLQTCDAMVGWSPCTARTPAAETCDGVDNDCDGPADEDIVPPTEPCVSTWTDPVSGEVAECEGEWTCATDNETTDWQCRGPQAGQDVCDYLDNDCDGLTDEDFRDPTTGVYDDLHNCGLCDFSCVGAILYALETACDTGSGAARCVVVECEEGYYRPAGTDTVCVPVGTVTDCAPCGEDAHCEALPGVCAELDGTRHCVRTCPNGTGCPDGYRCSAGVCTPLSSSCTCLADDGGDQRPCVVGNGFGTCTGFQTCVPATGWTSCSARTPAPEECNGIDDDCNGIDDDAILPPAESCARQNEEGRCTGVYVCAEGPDGAVDWQCNAPEPAPEECDYRDNDCDGATDEDFRDEPTGRYDDLHNCGVCDYSCVGAFEHATARCDATRPTPTCVVERCDPGYYPVGAFACLAVADRLCQPCADDTGCPVPGDRCLELDGSTVCGRDCAEGNLYDEGCPSGWECLPAGPGGTLQCVPLSGSCDCLEADRGATRPCDRENQHGVCAGQSACDPDEGWGDCSAPIPAPEQCNGFDDDCDGYADDGVEPPAETCERTSEAGRCTGDYVCAEGPDGTVDWQCTAPLPVPEICDARDNDCDSLTDEEFRDPTTGRYDRLEHCGACDYSCIGAFDHATARCDASHPTPTCVVERCDPGYYAAGEFACVAVADRLCQPCADDSACPVPGDHCLELDGRTVCGRDCAEGNLYEADCPRGYECLPLGPNSAPQCVPLSGSCDCLEGDTGTPRTCSRENEHGLCLGQEICLPDVGWTPCSAPTPAPEVCNGADDDCDGYRDNAPGVGNGCEVSAQLPDGPHACPGVNVCVPGGGPEPVCDARAPTVESCNYVDDDCDGATDEAFEDLYLPCTIGQGICARNGFFDCNEEGTAAVCNANVVGGTDEVCNGLDDDCDGFTDEDEWPHKGEICSVGLGICTNTGVRICNSADPSGPTVCSVSAYPQETEVCNDRDDDCDGFTDEESWTDKGTVCEVGRGVCRNTGVRICNAASPAGPTVCSVDPWPEDIEVCNDLDDDCDGFTDEEGWPRKGQVCTVGQGACTNVGIYVCNERAPWEATVCSVEPLPEGIETCNGVDDDCDGATDDGLVPDLCPLQAGVCQGAAEVCLGTAGWLSCDIARYTAWSPHFESREITCDGRDNDCDGQTDNDLPTVPCEEQRGVCAGATKACADDALQPCDAASFGPDYELSETRCDSLDNDCDGVTDEGYRDPGSGLYTRDDACGNCYTDCTQIYARAHGHGVCDLTGGVPRCVLRCCTPDDPDPACDGGEYFDLNAVPEDGCEFNLSPFALYVSHEDPSANDLSGCGRGPAGTGPGRWPCRTIAAGLDEAELAGRPEVRVADALYEEKVMVRNGISLFGGYRADTWERHIESTLTVVRGVDTNFHKATFVVDSVLLPTGIKGFVVYAPTNTNPGGNSYALYVRNSGPNLQIDTNTIYGGVAGPGADRAAASGGTPGTDGGGREALGCDLLFESTPGRAIPDNNPTGISETISVPSDCDFSHVALAINITHPYRGDLVVRLTNPAGTTVTLWNRFGGPADNLVAQFETEDVSAGPGHMSQLVAGPALGTWTLRVADEASQSVGTLQSWSLRIRGDRSYDALITDASPCGTNWLRDYPNGGVHQCETDVVSGGDGGGVGCPATWGAISSAASGASGQSADGAAAGVGGTAGVDGVLDVSGCVLPDGTTSGANGTNGQPGLNGTGGSGCADREGSVTAGHWTAGAALSGASGGHGAGGGGGGGGGGAECVSGDCDGRDVLGAHGGGGGSGGCGGAGGQAGGAGGGSFAIFIAGGAPPTIVSNRIYLGIGGEGGTGGNGGTGGSGGHGGEGGATFASCWYGAAGGKGGEGGSGGHGGGGGGGCGGSTFGIYTWDVGTTLGYCTSFGNVTLGGIAGSSGPGGASAGQSGGSGQPGELAACAFR